MVLVYSPLSDCKEYATKIGVIVTKLRFRQEMLYKNQTKGNNSKMEQGSVMVLVYYTSSHSQKHE